jgi:hypothetical protein
MAGRPGSRRLVRLASPLVAVALAVGVVACGDDDDDAATTDTSAAPTTGASTTASSEPTSSTDAPTTAPTTAPPTTTDGCPVADRTGTVEGTATGDVDGDGTDDTIEVVHTDSDEWFLWVTFGSGEGQAMGPVVGSGAIAGAQLVGAADVQGDGPAEVFVHVGSGASAAVIGLFTVSGCEVVPITFDGAPSGFPVGASIGAISGLQCGPEGTIFAYAGASSDGTAYDVTWEELSLEGTELTISDSGSGAASYGDELHTAASTFHCDTITYGV